MQFVWKMCPQFRRLDFWPSIAYRHIEQCSFGYWLIKESVRRLSFLYAFSFYRWILRNILFSCLEIYSSSNCYGSITWSPCSSLHCYFLISILPMKSTMAIRTKKIINPNIALNTVWRFSIWSLRSCSVIFLQFSLDIQFDFACRQHWFWY